MMHELAIFAVFVVFMFGWLALMWKLSDGARRARRGEYKIRLRRRHRNGYDEPPKPQ